MSQEGIVHFDCAGRTDAGERASNDDNFLIADLSDQLRVASTSVPELAPPAEPDEPLRRPVLMVADGISGQPRGALASALTIQAVVGQLGELTGPASTEAVTGAVVDGFEAAGGALRQLGRAAEETSPASSGTVALVDWPEVDLVHVGHSRCYLLHDGRLARLTHDHTMAEELRRLGCSAAPALNHVLTRAIGGEDQAPERRRVQLTPGDTLLVASNGLTDVLSEASLHGLLSSSPAASATERCERLLASALATHRVHRNVTVVVLTARC